MWWWCRGQGGEGGRERDQECRDTETTCCWIKKNGRTCFLKLLSSVPASRCMSVAAPHAASIIRSRICTRMAYRFATHKHHAIKVHTHSCACAYSCTHAPMHDCECLRIHAHTHAHTCVRTNSTRTHLVSRVYDDACRFACSRRYSPQRVNLPVCVHACPRPLPGLRRQGRCLVAKARPLPGCEGEAVAWLRTQGRCLVCEGEAVAWFAKARPLPGCKREAVAWLRRQGRCLVAKARPLPRLRRRDRCLVCENEAVTWLRMRGHHLVAKARPLPGCECRADRLQPSPVTRTIPVYTRGRTLSDTSADACMCKYVYA